jgi:ubiquinone/menaquinone biosynthesis C-methylase UbiE
MDRITEPELMIDIEQVKAFAAADFSEANEGHVRLFGRRFPDAPARAAVLDVGCGPGDITLRFAREYPGWTIHGVDGSRPMLEHAERARLQAGIANVRWIEGNLPGACLPLEHYDVLLSTGVLHHFHDPAAFWTVLRRCMRAGTIVFVVDFHRPSGIERAVELVERYAGAAPEVLRRDYFNSLCAAFTPAELRAQLCDHGLQELAVDIVSDRHVMVAGRAGSAAGHAAPI